MSWFRPERQASQTDALLDTAIAAWKTTRADETLSDDSRSVLFEAIRESSNVAATIPSIVRGYRLALIGLVPCLVIGAVLVVADRQGAGADPRLIASKQGSEVVFTLDGNGRDHRIERSSDPRFESASTERMVRGRYAETAVGGSSIVFYRID